MTQTTETETRLTQLEPGPPHPGVDPPIHEAPPECSPLSRQSRLLPQVCHLVFFDKLTSEYVHGVHPQQKLLRKDPGSQCRPHRNSLRHLEPRFRTLVVRRGFRNRNRRYQRRPSESPWISGHRPTYHLIRNRTLDFESLRLGGPSGWRRGTATSSLVKQGPSIETELCYEGPQVSAVFG